MTSKPESRSDRKSGRTPSTPVGLGGPIDGDTRIPGLRDNPPAKKGVAYKSPYVPKKTHMESRLREEFRKSVRTLFVNMSEEQVDAYVEEGFKLDAGALRAATFLAKSRAQPDRPLLYSERPPGMKFEEFMRHEYAEKGLLADPSFTLNSLRKIDKDLAQAYSNQSLRKDIPEDIRVKKATAHKNKRERSAGSAQP